MGLLGKQGLRNKPKRISSLEIESHAALVLAFVSEA